MGLNIIGSNSLRNCFPYSLFLTEWKFERRRNYWLGRVEKFRYFKCKVKGNKLKHGTNFNILDIIYSYRSIESL